MPITRPIVLLAAALFVASWSAGPALAQAAASKPAVVVEQAWTRATAAGQTVGGGFMTLRGGAAADRLVSAATPAAERVELHSMSMEGDVMRMRQVEAIELPAGQSVELKPGGLHLMLMGLKQPLKPGDQVPLTLRFEKAGEVKASLKVGAPGAASPHHAGEHKH